MSGLTKEILVGHLVGLKLSETVISAVCDNIPNSEPAERVWLKYHVTSNIIVQTNSIVQTAKRMGISLPNEILPRDWLTPVQVMKIVENCKDNLVSQRKQLIAMQTELARLEIKAFNSDKQNLMRRTLLFKQFIRVMMLINPKEVSKKLFERHLRLV